MRATRSRRATPSRFGNSTACASCVACFVGEPAEQRRVDEAGRDRAHADAGRGEVARGGERERDDAALRRRVRGLTDLAVVRGDRRGVDDHAALAVRVGLVRPFIPDAASRSTLNVPMRLISTILRNVSRLCGAPSRLMRAFGPTDARAVDARAQRRDLGRGGDRRGDLVLVGDVGLGERAVRARLATSSPLAASRSTITTCAPSAARRRAVASPMPEAPPVTRAVVRSSDMGADRKRSGNASPGRRVPAAVTDCSELQHDGLLQCYLDGEVETSVAFRVVVHLDGCRGARCEAEALEMLKRALRRQHVADPEVVTRLCTFAALLYAAAAEPSGARYWLDRSGPGQNPLNGPDLVRAAHRRPRGT